MPNLYRVCCKLVTIFWHIFPPLSSCKLNCRNCNTTNLQAPAAILAAGALNFSCAQYHLNNKETISSFIDSLSSTYCGLPLMPMLNDESYLEDDPMAAVTNGLMFV